MDNVENWYFTTEQLANTPSRRCGISESRELSFRQQAANFIQDMGQRLQVNQLCINTAIVYMHRFYVFHSFTEIHRNKLSLSALFLAAKVEEQPRKLEHLIKVAHACLHKDSQSLDVRSDGYQELMFEVVAHENILLQTLGFVLAIEHPHTYVVKVCQLVKASKDLAQTSYIMATTSLHMTTMCLTYKPTIVACVCIHLACKWSDWRIEPCSEGRDWFYYVDRSVKLEYLEELTDKFIAIMETSPHRFKKKFGQKEVHYHGPIPRNLNEDSSTNKPGTSASKHNEKQDTSSPGPSGISYDFAEFDEKPVYRELCPQPPITQPSTKPSTSVVQPPSTAQSQTFAPLAKKSAKAEVPHSISLDVYREKKEKERLHNKISAPPAAVPATAPQATSIMPPQVTKKPVPTIHETEKTLHRTSVKHVDVPISNKERVKVKEEPLDSSASMNKINHQMVKSNSDGSHYKERSNYSHKISHQVNDAVIKQDKIDVVIKPEKIDVKPERIEVSKPDRLDVVKVDKIELTKPEKVEFNRPEKIDSSRQERIDVKVEPKNFLPAPSIPTLAHRPSHKDENALGEVKKEKKEKHKKHSSHSSKEKTVSNHIDRAPPSGIKVKIPKTIINLSGIIPESSQKYPLNAKPESPKRSIKIKLPKPPENSKGVKPAPSTSIKLVITKDKSGSGSYSTSHKNERDRESRKRVHGNSIDGKGICNSPASKYFKVDPVQKTHHSSSLGSNKPSKSSRHSSHRSGMEHSINDSEYVMQHPSNGNNACSTVNAQSFSQGYMYNLTPPPPPPKLKGYGVPVGKTNSIPPLPPPLPPPQSPPPPPPPE